MGELINKAVVKPLEGVDLFVAALFLALANFVVVLDMTIVNVSLPHIAGGLAVSPTEGTYAITSYAVAEAITVPLTGWLAMRFGTLRVFVVCILLFGLFSALCGITNSLGGLISGRILQGFAGGPLMPLSQVLLMSIFPKDKQGAAIGLWGITTLTAPIAGPIVGGYISDVYSWHYIFLINIPIALICGVFSWKLLKKFETPIIKTKFDIVGIMLLILWVGSLQVMLDEGKNHDWFESAYICSLGITSLISFAVFIIWELTQEHPVIDLRIFRHRGFTLSVLVVSVAFGCMFGSVVLLPLWLQSSMGYTALSAGFVSASMGVLAVLMAPVAAKLSEKFDARYIVFTGILWLGIFTFIRSFATTDITSWQLSFPLLLQGIGLPMFFLPLTVLALGSVTPKETAAAAGLMNFLRTLSGAFAVSIVATGWDNQAKTIRTDMVANIAQPQELASLLGDVSIKGQETAKYMLENLLQEQVIMLATNQIFLVVSFTFIFAAMLVWLIPKPLRTVDVSAIH